MASNIPANLKKADIARFATKAAQLEKFKPAVAYWCQYHIVQQILSNGLHKADSECEAYTIDLMSRLEQYKDQLADNDAVTDDVAAQAYVEQFALETLQRAETTMRANKVTRQTAETFLAARTFLDLLSIWQNPLTPEIAAKSKFAKWHAVRILKAINTGEDPNLSNPPPEEAPLSPSAAGQAPVLDPNDPEVQGILGGPAYQQPSVQSAPSSPALSARLASNAPPPLMPPSAGFSNPRQPSHDVSPLSADSRKGSTSAASVTSAGGDYFPRTFAPETSPPSLPTAPPPIDERMQTSPDVPLPPDSYASPDLAAPSAPSALSPNVSDYYTQPSPGAPIIPPPQAFSPLAHPPPPQQPIPQNQQYSLPQPPSSVPVSQPQPPSDPIASNYDPAPGFKPDEDAMISAQKHAKWAVSALNFEDVDTAIKELRRALADLGAR